MATNKKATKELQTGGPGFWMGVASLVGAFFFQPAGLICGIMGKKQSEEAGYKNNFALAGIIISSIVMGLAVLWFIIFAVFAGSMFSQAKDMQKDILNTVETSQQKILDSTTDVQDAVVDTNTTTTTTRSIDITSDQVDATQAAAQAALDAAMDRLNN